MRGGVDRLEDVPPGADLLTVSDLEVHFPLRTKRRAKVRAVDGVSFAIRKGETLGLIGESGSGKSTVSRAILQLVKPTAGTVALRGVELTGLGKSGQRLMKRHCQMIFQDPHASLDPRMTIWESVREPMRVQGIGSAAEQRAKAIALLERVELGENHARRYPHELSGGQKQRISIARALSLSPDLLLCDEPVSALDVALQAGILNLFQEIQDDFGLSYLFITHDLSVVAHIADRIGVMYLGHLMELGSVEQIIDRPAHPYTEALISAQPVPVPKRFQSTDKIVLEGDIPSPVDPPSGCRFRTRCRYAEARCADEVPAWRPLDDGRWVACHFAEQLELRGRPSVDPAAAAAPASTSPDTEEHQHHVQ